ncbi:MAG: response regulator [Proteobacteria bacterium]|nr:response regulator [Pseudomonadota bacterium]
MSDNFVVHVVDDDEAVRESLTFTLNASDIDVVAHASAFDLLEHVSSLTNGLVITDVRMPGMTGLELVARLKQLGVSLPIIVLTGHADVAMAVEAMKAGVADFLEKPFDDAALLTAIDAARQRLQGDAGRQAERNDIAGRIALLTAREKEVFEAIVEGESNKSAALKLGISPRTVEIYRANVMEKMRARSLSDLVRMALLLKPTT